MSRDLLIANFKGFLVLNTFTIWQSQRRVLSSNLNSQTCLERALRRDPKIQDPPLVEYARFDILLENTSDRGKQELGCVDTKRFAEETFARRSEVFPSARISEISPTIISFESHTGLICSPRTAVL